MALPLKISTKADILLNKETKMCVHVFIHLKKYVYIFISINISTLSVHREDMTQGQCFKL